MKKTNIKLTKKDILCELAKRDFKYFTKYTHKNYIFSKFSLTVMEALNQFLVDLDNGRRPILIIEAPPQHGKSELASRKFPAFAFGKNPDYRIAGCSYSSDLAVSMNRDIQRIMLEDNYSEVFPNSSLNKKRVITVDNQPLRNSERFDIADHKGYYVCCGVGGALTGKSVDIGIIDDPTKNMQEARSEANKETLRNWYQSVFLTRLSKNSGQLIMATRWAIDDLIGYIIEKNKGNDRVKLLKFPAINENNEALIPELHPLEQLLEQKNLMDVSSWEALYQQSPIIVGGNIIKSEWFKKPQIIPPSFDYVYITSDTAFSTKTSADNSVFLLCGIKDKELYLLDCLVGKWGFPELKQKLYDFWKQAQAKYSNFSNIYIENKASGQSLLQEFTNIGLPVKGILPTVKGKIDTKDYTADKYTRLMEVISDLSNGYVNISTRASWIDDFLNECEAFTGVDDAHDDRVDTLIYALKVRRQLLFDKPIDWGQLNKMFFGQ